MNCDRVFLESGSRIRKDFSGNDTRKELRGFFNVMNERIREKTKKESQLYMANRKRVGEKTMLFQSQSRLCPQSTDFIGMKQEYMPVTVRFELDTLVLLWILTLGEFRQVVEEVTAVWSAHDNTSARLNKARNFFQKLIRMSDMLNNFRNKNTVKFLVLSDFKGIPWAKIDRSKFMFQSHIPLKFCSQIVPYNSVTLLC